MKVLMPHRRFTLPLGVLLLSLGFTSLAQTTRAVPDVIGQSPAPAAAAINAARLRVGLIEVRAAEGADAVGTVAAQSPWPGVSLDEGESIDLVIEQIVTARLIYDDDHLTVINLTSSEVPIADLEFRAVGGESTASFAGSQWGSTQALRASQCLQIWSVPRSEGSTEDGCAALQRWQSTSNPEQHFWLTATAATHFEVTQGGVGRGHCAIGAGTCDLGLASSRLPEDSTPYVYLLYTRDHLALINTSSDRWMPASTLMINGLRLGDPVLFERQQIVGDVRALAPGQCLLFTVEGTDLSVQPPEGCEPIAQAVLSEARAFWRDGFRVLGLIDGIPRECPAALRDETALCLIPR
jgi:hypothetical protein